MLNINVCIKQVPEPESFDNLSIDPCSGTINRDEFTSVMNPLDRHALEEALKIRDELGGHVNVFTMGPAQAKRCLEDALAIGADRGVLLSDRCFAGADSLVTADVLSNGIRTLGNFDLILCGNETIDGATAQVPAQIAEFLNIPHVTHVRKIDVVDHLCLVVERKVEGGYFKVKVRLPAVLSVLKSINTVRIPTAMGIMEAADKEIITIGASDLEGCLDGKKSPTRVMEVFQSPMQRKAKIFEGAPEEIVQKIISKLYELKVLEF